MKNHRNLNERQRAFCEAYIKSGSATSAAVSAGYSEKTAGQIGFQNLRVPSIAAEIARLTARIEKKAELNAELVLSELRNLVVSNVADMYDADGNIKPINELPPEIAKTISSIEFGDIKGSGPRGVRKLKTHNKLAALELASKLLGMISANESAQASVHITLAAPPELPERVDTAQLRPCWE